MKKTLTIFTLMFLIAGQLFAIPANPNPVVFTQPDGKNLTVILRGDERIHWNETLDGYTLLYNSDHYLTYAQLDEDGNLQPSDVIATDIEDRDIVVNSFLYSIDKKLFFSDIQQQMILKVWEIEDEYEAKGEKGITGLYKTLCAFVQFPNKSFQKAMSQFEDLFNQIGYTGNGTGSVRDFFKESSYEQFDLQITLCGIYTAPQNESYYAGNDGTQRCNELASWAAQQVAAEDIDFTEYDNNGNGKVDGFHFIFAGVGQEMGGGTSTIWSHKWQFTPAVCKNGKCISIYSCTPELLWGSTITTVGVIAHEMTHAVLGAPDFYDTNYGTGGQYTGTGEWDVMAEGSWNGNPSGNCPPHHNMYTKIQAGWVTPVVLNSTQSVTGMTNSAENPVAYRINTGTNNEYYLLENRQKIKFDASVPGSGLIIYHVHSQINQGIQQNNINATHPQKMYPVCASSNTAIPTGGSSSYGNINSSGCPFPGTSGKTAFNGTSTPRMFQWTNTVINNKPITNITHNTTARTISFNFMEGVVIEYTLTLNASPSNGGTVSGAGIYNSDASVTATATPNTGFSFYNWTKDGVQVSTNPNYTFNITENTTLVANFKSNNANLTSLTVSPGELTPAFAPDVVNYTVDVTHDIETISITGIAASSKAAVTGNVTNNPLETGETNFTITVTAEDNTIKDYVVKVIRAGNAIDNYQAQKIKIFPNPAGSLVNIVSENNMNAIIIFDSFGKKVKEINNIGKTSYQLDIKDYIRNIYYLNVDGVTLKLVVSD